MKYWNIILFLLLLKFPDVALESMIENYENVVRVRSGSTAYVRWGIDVDKEIRARTVFRLEQNASPIYETEFDKRQFGSTQIQIDRRYLLYVTQRSLGIKIRHIAKRDSNNSFQLVLNNAKGKRSSSPVHINIIGWWIDVCDNKFPTELYFPLYSLPLVTISLCSSHSPWIEWEFKDLKGTKHKSREVNETARTFEFFLPANEDGVLMVRGQITHGESLTRNISIIWYGERWQDYCNRTLPQIIHIEKGKRTNITMTICVVWSHANIDIKLRFLNRTTIAVKERMEDKKRAVIIQYTIELMLNEIEERNLTIYGVSIWKNNKFVQELNIPVKSFDPLKKKSESTTILSMKYIIIIASSCSGLIVLIIICICCIKKRKQGPRNNKSIEKKSNINTLSTGYEICLPKDPKIHFQTVKEESFKTIQTEPYKNIENFIKNSIQKKKPCGDEKDDVQTNKSYANINLCTEPEYESDYIQLGQEARYQSLKYKVVIDDGNYEVCGEH